MFPRDARIEGFDPELAARHRRRKPPPGRPRRADRVGKLRQPARDGSPGQPADQQVRRRLSGQALLRRLRIRRRRRAPGDRTLQAAVRRRLRERAAAFGFAGQPGRVPGAAAAGRHDPRHVARPRRPPHARREGEHQRQAVQRRAVRRGRQGPDRLRRSRTPRARTQAEDDRRRLQRVLADHRLGEVPRDRRQGRRLPVRRHGARRRPRRRGRVPEPGAARARRHLHHAQDAARPARRHHRRQGRTKRSKRSCSRSCSPASRAAR